MLHLADIIPMVLIKSLEEYEYKSDSNLFLSKALVENCDSNKVNGVYHSSLRFSHSKNVRLRIRARFQYFNFENPRVQKVLPVRRELIRFINVVYRGPQVGPPYQLEK